MAQNNTFSTLGRNNSHHHHNHQHLNSAKSTGLVTNTLGRNNRQHNNVPIANPLFHHR